MRFLLYRMSRVRAVRSDAAAKCAIEQADKEKAAPFAKHPVNLYAEKDARPEQKYVLPPAALPGNDDAVDQMRSGLNARAALGTTAKPFGPVVFHQSPKRCGPVVSIAGG